MNRFWASTAASALIGISMKYPNPVLFMLGWPASEFAQIWIGAQMINLITWFRNSRNAFSFPIALGMLINMWALKIGMHSLKTAFQSREVFSLALTKANISPQAGSSLSNTLGGALVSLIPLFAVSRRGKNVKIERTVPYASIADVDPELLAKWKTVPKSVRPLVQIARGRISQWMSMDVFYLEDNLNREAPVLASFHGGAWALADKLHSAHALFNRIASRGIVVCIINYRMSPEATWPMHIQDCLRGLHFVERNCSQWGGDATKLFLSGESAGAHLCALAATASDCTEFHPFPNFKMPRIQGVLPLYGIWDLTNSSGHSKLIQLFTSIVLLDKPFDEKVGASNASPLVHLRKRFTDQQYVPPFFTVHGTLDVLAPIKDSVVFFTELKKLRQQRSENEDQDVYVRLEEAHHAVGFLPSLRSNALGDAMADFIFHYSSHSVLENLKPTHLELLFASPPATAKL